MARDAPGRVLFGGPAWPVGWAVGAIVEQLLQLPPLQAPRRRELVVATAAGWTAHVDNSQPFEEQAAYERRLIRDRFTRDMLLRYLAAVGIDADNPAFYGDGLLIESRQIFRPRTLSLEDARRQYRS